MLKLETKILCDKIFILHDSLLQIHEKPNFFTQYRKRRKKLKPIKLDMFQDHSETFHKNMQGRAECSDIFISGL
jgi:acyl carrier protein phosphodiesterase